MIFCVKYSKCSFKSRKQMQNFWFLRAAIDKLIKVCVCNLYKAKNLRRDEKSACWKSSCFLSKMRLQGT